MKNLFIFAIALIGVASMTCSIIVPIPTAPAVVVFGSSLFLTSLSVGLLLSQKKEELPIPFNTNQFVVNPDESDSDVKIGLTPGKSLESLQILSNKSHELNITDIDIIGSAQIITQCGLDEEQLYAVTVSFLRSGAEGLRQLSIKDDVIEVIKNDVIFLLERVDSEVKNEFLHKKFGELGKLTEELSLQDPDIIDSYEELMKEFKDS